MSFDHIYNVPDNPDIDQPLDIPFSLYGFPWTSEQADELRAVMNRFIAAAGGLNLPEAAMFAADSMIVFGHRAGFQSDKKFRHAVRLSEPSTMQKGLAWRSHVLCWAAGHALKTQGSFVECGCREGFWIALIANYHNLGTRGPQIYGYDAFDLGSSDLRSSDPGSSDPGSPIESQPKPQSPPCFEQIQKRFANQPLITLTRGHLPQCIESEPEHIAYLHIDRESQDAEISTLETLFPRLVKGSMTIIEDYGWQTFKKKRASYDRFAKSEGLFILELPTGQGLIMRS